MLACLIVISALPISWQFVIFASVIVAALFLVSARTQGPDRTIRDAINRFESLLRGTPPVIPPVTPAGRPFMRLEGRFMLPEEKASAQGVVFTLALNYTNLSEIAGQAMCGASSIPALIAFHGWL